MSGYRQACRGNALAAAELLEWRGEMVGPVGFGGVRFWAVAELIDHVHAGRRRARVGALVGARERLAGWLADGGPAAVGGPAVRLVGALVTGADARPAMREASLLAAYTQRAVLARISTRDVLTVLVDAALLDIGVVSVVASGLEVLSAPGPRTGPGLLTAREWDLLETVYEAWLDARRTQAGSEPLGSGEHPRTE